jgi:hypothetical protein
MRVADGIGTLMYEYPRLVVNIGPEPVGEGNCAKVAAGKRARTRASFQIVFLFIKRHANEPLAHNKQGLGGALESGKATLIFSPSPNRIPIIWGV